METIERILHVTYAHRYNLSVRELQTVSLITQDLWINMYGSTSTYASRCYVHVVYTEFHLSS